MRSERSLKGCTHSGGGSAVVKPQLGFELKFEVWSMCEGRGRPGGVNLQNLDLPLLYGRCNRGFGVKRDTYFVRVFLIRVLACAFYI